jgi:hypothetical protein
MDISEKGISEMIFQSVLEIFYYYFRYPRLYVIPPILPEPLDVTNKFLG